MKKAKIRPAYSLLILGTLSLLISCATAHIVVGDLQPDIEVKQINEESKIFSILHSNEQPKILMLVKESSFFPEFSDRHFLLTNLDGKPITKHESASINLNDSAGEKIGALAGRAIGNTLSYAVSGILLPIGDSDEVTGLVPSNDYRFLSVTRGGIYSSEVLLFDIQEGKLVKTVKAEYITKNAERKRIYGHAINRGIGFDNENLYITSGDLKFGWMDVYLTKVNLETLRISEFDIAEEEQPATVFSNSGLKGAFFNGTYLSVTEDSLRVFDVKEEKIIKTYSLGEYKGFNSIYCLVEKVM